MNPEDLENIFKKATEVKLEKNTKDAMRQNISLFVKANPAKVAVPFWQAFFTANTMRVPAVALASLLLVFMVGGTMVSANSALPGDWLYSVKVGVNENIVQVLAFTDEQKLEVNTQIAQVRLQEFEELSAKGNVDAMQEAKINDDFKKHSERASVYLKKLNKKIDNKKSKMIGAEFEESLKVKGAALQKLRKDDDQKATSAKGFSEPGVDKREKWAILKSVEDVTLDISKVNKGDDQHDDEDNDDQEEKSTEDVKDSVQIELKTESGH